MEKGWMRKTKRARSEWSGCVGALTGMQPYQTMEPAAGTSMVKTMPHLHAGAPASAVPRHAWCRAG